MTGERRYDRRGVPIYPGDLCRADHFRGARGKRYYLYHVAINAIGRHGEPTIPGLLEMVPTSEMEPTHRGEGGRYWLSHEMASALQVISGHGPGNYLDFDDRPKQKIAKAETTGGSL